MTPGTEAIFDAALALPPEQRAVLVERLLDSLQDQEQRAVDAAWASEAEGRVRAYKQGVLKALPGDEMVRKMLNGSA